MAKDKTREFYAARVNAAARVRERARELGASDEIAELIGAAQLWRGSRARNNDASRAADGIRRADAFKMRSRDDIITRRAARRDGSIARADAARRELARARRELDAIERAIERASGKTRRELKNMRRAARHRYDLAFGTLARLDRKIVTSRGAIVTPRERREIAGLIWEDAPSRVPPLTQRDDRPVDARGVVLPIVTQRNMLAIVQFIMLARSLARSS